MMNLNQVLGTRVPITGASEACWDIWNGRGLYLDLGYDGFTGWSGSLLLDRDTQNVMEVTFFPPGEGVPMRWMEPSIKDQYMAESKRRGVDPDQAFDNVRFIDVEDPNQLIEAMLMAEKDKDVRETEEMV